MLESRGDLARRAYSGAIVGLMVGGLFSALPLVGALIEGP